MFKKILVIGLVIYATSAFAQNPYNDAKKIVSLGDYNTADSSIKCGADIPKILHLYTHASETDKKAIVIAFAGNPFLKKIDTNCLYINDGAKLTSKDELNNVLSQAGGINVTNFADGAAQFLVERFKEELTITFFQKFQNDISCNKYSDLQILFPETYKLLSTIGSGVYNFSAYLNTMRETFIKDLTNLYPDFKKDMAQAKYQAIFKKYPELGSILKNAFYFIDCFANGTSPGLAIKNYNPANLDFNNALIDSNARNGIHLLQILSESFHSLSKSQYWVPADSLENMDNATRTVYLGLLYQQIKNAKISFWDRSRRCYSLADLIKDTIAPKADSLQKYLAFIYKIADKTQEIQNNILAIKTETKNGVAQDYNDYYNLYNSSLDLVEDAFGFLDLPYLQAKLNLSVVEVNLINRQATRWLYVARSSGELYVDIRTKNYSSSIINALGIMDSVLPQHKIGDLKAKRDTSLQALNRVYKVAKVTNINKRRIQDTIKARIKNSDLTNMTIKEIKGFLNNADTDTSKWLMDSTNRYISNAVIFNLAMDTATLKQYILQYGTFLAAVAAAKSSDDVKAAIESIALPSGSFSIKRNTTSNIAINGYMGGFGGFEYMPALKQNPWSFSYGVSAPIGVAFSWGNHNSKSNLLGKNWLNNSSWTIFVPVIDLGAIASFRVGNDSSKIASDVQLKDIIAPGLYFYYGFRNSPLTIGLGGQMGPQLRQITATSQNADQNVYYRVGFNLLVDIPVLNIHTKQ